MTALTAEVQAKASRVAEYCRRAGVKGVLFSTRSGFSWLSGGRCNRIANSSPVGVASLLATADGKIACFCDRIESPRFTTEELVGTGIPVIDYPWEDKPEAARVVTQAVGDLCGGGPEAVVGEMGLGWAGVNVGAAPAKHGGSEAIQALRYSLLPEEISRYRAGGGLAATAMERACRRLLVGMTEHEAVGLLAHEVHAAGLNPVVLLAAADDRIEKYRHPIAKDTKIARRIMLVLCSEYGGLISNLTRFVAFAPETEEHRKRQRAVAAVDADVNRATAAGKSLDAMFQEIAASYARHGFDGEWRLHHQGGTTGYAGRDHFAHPGNAFVIVPNQAFAWNPSITGVKSEDTMVLVDGKAEFVTSASASWPVIEVGGMKRPDVLVVG